MSEEQGLAKESVEKSALKCLENLKKNNIGGHYFANRSEALSYLLGTIPPGATVGFGDSETVQQTGLPRALYDRGQKLISPFWEDDPDTYSFPRSAKARKATMDALFADCFIAGINAITLDGKIVNTDAGGNRVAAIIFGPRRVILVAGANKIVANAEAAIERIRKVAAPLNAHRHALEHDMGSVLRDMMQETGQAARPHMAPCALTGECADCDTCLLCCYTTIIEHQLFPRIEVVLIGEKLGL